MMATCLLLGVEARLAKTDAVLLLCCVAAMGVMARAYLTQSSGRDIPWRHALILWTALAGGILLKGPLILMVVGLAALFLVIADRSARWLLRLRPLVGVLWILVLVLPWFVAIMGRAGDSFLQESVGQDLFAKIFKGQETHGAPPGYYLLLFWLTFWPAAPLAAVAAPAVWRHRARAAVALPAGVGRAVLDRVRTGRDQAAALRAAALSGDRDPDRARDRAARPVGQSASDALHRDVADLRRRDPGRRGLAGALHPRPVRLARLAVRRGRA